MLALILFAFSNFFFIMNKNTLKGKTPLVPTYIGNNVIDSVIQMWRLALGEFDDEGFADAKYSPLIYLFFFFATFIVLVTFMNMLIAIMSNTFATV